jgi:hypothetical protein
MDEYEKKTKKEIDKNIDELIDRFGIDSVRHKIQNIMSFAPKEEEVKIIKKKMEEFGLTYYSDMSLELEKIEFWGQTSKDGCKISVELNTVAPFKVRLTLKDSYYEPRDIYEYDCGPSYLDSEHNEWLQNENWEPGEIKTLNNTFDKPEAIWEWIKTEIPKLEDEWAKIPMWKEDD